MPAPATAVPTTGADNPVYASGVTSSSYALEPTTPCPPRGRAFPRADRDRNDHLRPPDPDHARVRLRRKRFSAFEPRLASELDLRGSAGDRLPRCEPPRRSRAPRRPPQPAAAGDVRRSRHRDERTAG